MIPKITKVIYSADLRTRIQYYDNGVTVGFCSERQDFQDALDRVIMHVTTNRDPAQFVCQPAGEEPDRLDEANDWVTIYEGEQV